MANRNALEFALREQEIQLVMFVTDAWLQIAEVTAELEALEERLIASELALDGVLKGQSVGLWSTVEVLDTMEQVMLARFAQRQMQTANQEVVEIFRLITTEEMN